MPNIVPPHFNRWSLPRPPDGPWELNRASPQAKGLVGWWPTIASRGSVTVRDLARVHHAARSGTTTWTVHPDVGPILDYDGTSGYISFARTASIPLGSTPFTVAVWIQDDTAAGSLATFHRIISYYDGTRNIQLGLGRGLGAVTRRFYIFNKAGSGDADEVTATPVPTGLQFVCATFDGTNYAIYRNGRDDSGGAMSDGIGVFNSNSTTVYIGQRGNGAYVDGLIGDTRVYNCALSPAEIWSLYTPDTRWELYRPMVRWWTGYTDAGADYTLTAAQVDDFIRLSWTTA